MALTCSFGLAVSSVRVQGCCRAVTICSVAPTSIGSPRCITTMRFKNENKIAELSVVMQHKSSLHSPNDRFVIALHSPDGNLQTGLPVGPPEKRAAELAFWVQQDTFSESGLSAKYAELRGFSAIFRGKPQSFSAVETVWRREGDSNPRYSF